ncbi:MAG: histone deacetylase family protein, partial [Shinella sp.]|uniref:histone deacetylase family protein n=1 Tax=Shinella sp. TaxID=1870904 RepID=UPI0040354DDA
GLETALKVHDAGYLSFLETAWDQWKAAGYNGEAIATSFPVRRTSPRIPTQIDGLLGYYCNAAETAISPGTWEAAVSSMQTALTATDIVAGGEKAAFGGYCFINNAAVAAQRVLDKGAKKVAVLDVDFHHGNGTQDIFYERGDVYFASLHGDPAEAFPHFLGYAEETGKGAGVGTTQNYPMPPGTPYSVWEAALHDALKRIAAFGAEAIVLSLGVDTFEKDPISFFKLVSADYITMGRAVAASGVPVLVVMEGGYGVPE